MDFPAFDLTGQVALVTGAARGLGEAISLALAHAGADVALGLRDVKAPGSVASEVAALGRRVLPLQMDVRRLDQIFQAVEETVKTFGRLDILVNNAGLAPENLAENVLEEDFDLTLASRTAQASTQERRTVGLRGRGSQSRREAICDRSRRRRRPRIARGQRFPEALRHRVLRAQRQRFRTDGSCE